jgi:ABC-type sugar transport system ATPase subunit
VSEPDVEPTHQPLLRIEGLTKRFANVHALTDVGFALRGGEVLALVGENGAGKSTLLKILSGDYKADAGVVAIDGRPAVFTSPREARAAEVPVRVCGEMAGRPLEAMALIGIGAENFSITPAGVGPLKAMIRSLDAAAIRSRMDQLLVRPPKDMRKALSDWARRHSVTIG